MIDEKEKLQLLLLHAALDNVCINVITSALRECRLVDNGDPPVEDHRHQAKYWIKTLAELTSGRDIGSDIIVAWAVRDSLWSELTGT